MNLGERGELVVYPVSGTYLFTPHGTTFAAPVTIAVEYDEEAARVAGSKLYMLVSKNSTAGPWEIVEGTRWATSCATNCRPAPSSTWRASRPASGAPGPPRPGPPRRACGAGASTSSDSPVERFWRICFMVSSSKVSWKVFRAARS
jgi:hypothetical protein